MQDTLTPHIFAYINRRRADGSYRPASIRGVQPRLMSLARHFGARPINQLTTARVELWLADCRLSAPISYNAYLASVKVFCADLKLRKVISVDPAVGMPRRRMPRSVPRAITADAVRQVLDACLDRNDRLIIWLMVGCGLRRNEVAQATWADFDPTGPVLLVHGKGGNERLVAVPLEVVRALTVDRAPQSGPIVAHDGKPYCVEAIGKRASAAMQRAGIKHAAYDGVSGHALRHTAASDVLDSCHDLRVVQEMLGHVELSSTSIYLRRAGISSMATAMAGRDYLHAA